MQHTVDEHKIGIQFILFFLVHLLMDNLVTQQMKLSLTGQTTLLLFLDIYLVCMHVYTLTACA